MNALADASFPSDGVAQGSSRVDAISEFAGADVPAMCLREMGILGKHVCFEIDAAAKAFLRGNFPQAVVAGSVHDRELADLGRPSVIPAGFPCQLFSILGLGLGADDWW